MMCYSLLARAFICCLLFVGPWSQDHVFRASAELVSIPLLTLDTHTHDVVLGLRAEDLTIRVDRKIIPIAALDATPTRSAAIALIVDWRGVLDAQRAELAEALRNTRWVPWTASQPHRTQIAIFQTTSCQAEDCEDNIPIATGFISEEDDLQAAIRSIDHEVQTTAAIPGKIPKRPVVDVAGVHAIAAAASALATLPRDIRKEIVIITSDADYMPSDLLSPVLRSMRNHHERLSTIQLGGALNDTDRILLDFAKLRHPHYSFQVAKRLTHSTGGLLLSAPVDTAPQILRQALIDLRGGYTLSFVPYSGMDPHRLHSISVEESRSHQRRGIKLVYSSEFEMAGPGLRQRAPGSEMRPKFRP